MGKNVLLCVKHRNRLKFVTEFLSNEFLTLSTPTFVEPVQRGLVDVLVINVVVVVVVVSTPTFEDFIGRRSVIDVAFEEVLPVFAEPVVSLVVLRGQGVHVLVEFCKRKK